MSLRQTLSREILEQTDIMNQIFLTDSSRTVHPNKKKKEYTFFSEPQGILFKIDYILGHKASLNRSNESGVIFHIISDHHRLKYDFKKTEIRENYKLKEN